MSQGSARNAHAVVWMMAVALGVGGCVSAAQQQAARAQRERAQAAYTQAAADPYVQAYAQLPLMDARRALQAAEQASSVDEIAHKGYMAERKAQVALAMAEAKRGEEVVDRLGKETTEVLLQTREREAAIARAEAEARARELEEARQQAALQSRQMADELERTRREADARARELEQARREAEQRTDAARAEAEARVREAERLRQEAEQARAAAETASREAERARMEADAKHREVEEARLQADAQSRLAEQARLESEARTREAEQARLQVEKARADALARELPALRAKQTERGIVVTMGDALFATGKADVAPGAQRSLDKLADFLQKNPARAVLVEGYTDSAGPEDVNLRLSQQRADMVKQFLVRKGVGGERIETAGYGTRYPVASNDSPAGRQQNRRVEIVISEEGVTPVRR